MSQSTKRRRPRKTISRHSLTRRSDGRYCKKINGRMWYFGRDEKVALAIWEAQKDAIMAGKDPEPEDTGEVDLEELCDRFLNFKKQLLLEGSLAQRTFDEYFATCTRLIDLFGKKKAANSFRPQDFERLRADISKTWGLVRLANEMVRAKSVFKFGADQELIEKAPKYGQGFKKPSASALEKLRNGKARMFEPSEILNILKAAGTQMRAMTLLGVNCGYGPDDVARLPIHAVNLQAGWINFARGKTGTRRRSKLWPETVQALQAVLAERKTPADDSNALFITKYFRPWDSDDVGHEFGKLLKKIGMKKDGLGIYGLRRSHRTASGGAGDLEAAGLVMGHAAKGVAGKHYVVHIDDARLERVANHVRTWLLGAQNQ